MSHVAELERIEDALLTIELSGPPKLFVINLPADTPRGAELGLHAAVRELRLAELGHRCLLLYGALSLGQMTDAELRGLGLMRILTADAPADARAH